MSTDETILWEESFLMTKEDYIDYSQEKSRMMTPKINMILLRIFGILAVCGGVIAMIYGSSEFWIKASFILLIQGTVPALSNQVISIHDKRYKLYLLSISEGINA